MKVELAKTFLLPGSAEVAWTFLQDIEAVAACMPGAKIVERSTTGGHRGTVTVRLGPATISFRGELEVRDVDAAARSLRLLGKGTDSTGTSGASMDLSARIEEVGDRSSNLVGKSSVAMSGKAAAFGGRMMTSVADQILKQFGENFAARVAALDATETTLPAREPTPTAAVAAVVDDGPATLPMASVPAQPITRELNALALLWAALVDWLRNLFRKRTA